MDSLQGKSNISCSRECVVTYAHYACVADCADAMADAWEDTAGCAQGDHKPSHPAEGVNVLVDTAM